MITKRYLKSALFCNPLHRADPVLLQRSLMHSDSVRFSQTIIHSALCKDLNEKLPEPLVIWNHY
jgi:hypothetical protein